MYHSFHVFQYKYRLLSRLYHGRPLLHPPNEYSPLIPVSKSSKEPVTTTILHSTLSEALAKRTSQPNTMAVNIHANDGGNMWNW